MNMNTDKAGMLCQLKTTFSKQYMDKPFKYQRSSLNIIILTVVSNVLFSKVIDVILILHCLLLNSNYSISVKCHTCI